MIKISLTFKYNAVLLELCAQCMAFKEFAHSICVDIDTSEFLFIYISGIDTLNLFTEPGVMT